MTDLDKAREWAEDGKGLYNPGSRTKAATDIILSLPDQWVDAEKVRELIDLYKHARDANASGDEGWVINDLVIGNLEGLLSPKLPTLADMDEDVRHTMIGEDVNVEGWNNPSMLVAVHKNEGAVLEHNWIYPWPFVEVRPLSELTPVNATADQPARSSGSPKSPLPRPEECCGKCPETIDGGYDCTCEDNPRCSKNAPNPADVPANEPWLIEVDGEKAIGTRYQDDTDVPWSVATLDGSFAGDHNDREVSLIHKLVPETHTLPEGMRLADHEEYGRVVVSPGADADGDHKVFRSASSAIAGASWGYSNERELNFLDGDQHV